MTHSDLTRAAGSRAFTRRGLLAGAGAGALLAAAARPAAAVLRLDITQGNVQPIPIALPDFLARYAG